MAGYLITRLFLARAFSRADQPPAPQVASSQAGVDTNSETLKTFWKPDRKADPTHEKRLKTWLTEKGIHESVVSFLNKAEYASQRAQAIREIRIPDIDRIKSFWKPGGMVDPAHEKELMTWLTKNGIDESVVSFLSKPQYTGQRAQAIRELQIP
ncbi:MAG: hypothetical protein ACREXK_12520 [Gammaproteobacteria bacterium]